MADDTPSRSESRPRPQYGEYATPQDQAAAIATSLPPVPPVLLPSDRPTSVAPAPDPSTRTSGPPQKRGLRDAVPDSAPHDSATNDTATHDTAPQNTAPRGTVETSVAGRSAAPGRQRRWDLVLSTGLMVYGFLNVLSGLFQYADLGAFLDQLYEAFNIGNYVATGMERPIGIAIVASNLLSFTLVAWFTVRALKAHRIAFWIPLVGGVVATVVSALLLQVLVANDPAITAFLEKLLTR